MLPPSVLLALLGSCVTEPVDVEPPPKLPIVAEAPTDPPESPRLSFRADNKAAQAALDSASQEGAEARLALTVDRPLIRPGESLWVRVWDLTAGELSGHAGDVTLTLLDPRDNLVDQARLASTGAGAATGFDLAPTATGGLYTLEARVGDRVVRRPVAVAAFEEPRIRKELDLLRDAYGPGDEVVAALTVAASGAGPLANHAVKVVVQVEGRSLPVIEARTDAQGEALLRFVLPAEMSRPDAVLTVMVEEGGWTESITREIPIVLDEIQLDWFPEGGDLVSGLPSRVYVRARNAHGEPADVAGVLLDDDGAEVGTFRTVHDGLGRTELMPLPGRTYTARITEPSGVQTSSTLPEAKADGCVLRSFDDLDGERPEVRVGVRCSWLRPVVVTGSLRGQAFDTATVEAGPIHPAIVHLRTPDRDRHQGVARIAVLSDDLEPMAERLVYRNRTQHLQIEVERQGGEPGPRDEIVLDVTTRDPSGEPVAADLSLAVVDDRLLKHADDEHGNLLTQLHLDPWIRGQLEDPGWYFDPDEPEAGLGLDLVLGTHGHRRFEPVPVPVAAKEVGHPLQLDRQVAANAGILGTLGMNLDANLGVEFGGLLATGGPQMPLGVRTGGGGVGAKGVSSVASVRGDPITILGSLDRSFVDPVVKRHMNQLRYCYQRELQKQPDLGGKVVVKFTIAAAGVVSFADIASSTLDNEVVERCLVGRFLRMRFAESAGGGIVIVRYPLVFMRRDGTSYAQRPERLGGHPVQFAPPAYTMVRTFPKPDYGGQRAPTLRTDFRSTVAWEPSVKTGADGKATVRFHLNDAVTTFRITAEGIGGGHAGRLEQDLHSTLPFSLDVPLPTEVSFGDRLLMPVRLTSRRDQAIDVALTTSISAPLQPEDGTGTQQISVAGGQGETTLVPIRVPDVSAQAEIRVTASAGGLSDAMERTLSVVPRGFPHRWTAGGKLQGSASHTLVVEDALTGGTEGRLTLLPSSLSSLMDGMASMVRIPGGCFEQTSSSNYPNILILRHLDRTGSNAGLQVDRTTALRTGYDSLTGYQVGSGGFETFGSGPGKEALSAYGILQFRDMATVFPGVDDAMVRRDAEFLLASRNATGGYRTTGTSSHQWGAAPQQVTDAFITWALVEAEALSDGPEVQQTRALAAQTDDPYLLAVAVLALQHVDRSAAGRAATRLAALQAVDGSFPGAETSVVRSGGNDLRVETTSLALMALHRQGSLPDAVAQAMGWLIDSRRGGYGWGSTQATVLALKALDSLGTANGGPKKGSVRVNVDGAPAGTLTYDGTEVSGVGLDLGPHLSPGAHTIELVQVSGDPVPYTLDATWRRSTPPNSADAPLLLETSMSEDRMALGETVRLTVHLDNPTASDIASPIARLGLPAGVRAETWQLEALRDQGRIAFFETRPREVTLYWEGMGPGETSELHLDLVAEVPGTFTAPPSSAYPYYNADAKVWTAGATLDIRP